MKPTILSIYLVLLSFTAITHAQSWKNPANKYLDVHKDYAQAECPIAEDGIKYLVYFARDRERLHDHPFLGHDAFKGAQIMYSWRELEPEQDRYNFSLLEADMKYLRTWGKTLFIQIQDVTFSENFRAIPDYLNTDEYAGGVVLSYEHGIPQGWVAKRWNPKVRERFHHLLNALGARFDGKIEGVNLQETAIGIEESPDNDFTEESYLKGVKANMLALKRAFPTSTTMIYANFMPGEWLPWEDKGYLKDVYAYGEKIGVGLGAPDLMITRKGQLNHALAQMHETDFSVPIGIAVQDGNYIGKTGADTDYDERHDQERKSPTIVPILHAFAKDFLKVKYMFWVDQAPYFEEEVLPCFANE